MPLGNLREKARRNIDARDALGHSVQPVKPTVPERRGLNVLKRNTRPAVTPAPDPNGTRSQRALKRLPIAFFIAVGIFGAVIAVFGLLANPPVIFQLLYVNLIILTIMVMFIIVKMPESG
jgi:hypothetical protein